MEAVVAHGSAGGADEMLFLVAAAIFVVGVVRLAEKGAGSTRWIGIPVMAAAVAIGVVPPLLGFGRRTPTARISTAARLEFTRPEAGETIKEEVFQVVLRLDGARITSAVTTKIRPDEGHVHLTLDGTAVSIDGLRARITTDGLRAGLHLLQAEFVASDHAPFRPRVVVVRNFHFDS